LRLTRDQLTAWVVAWCLLKTASGGDGAVAHPLDPLSAEEIAAAVAVLRQSGDTDATTRFALIDLQEPDKPAVLAPPIGPPAMRQAFVVVRQHRTVYEATVDLSARNVTRWEPVPGVESGILGEEWEDAQRITIADPDWRAAMRRRGYDPATAEVFCAPLSAGYSADPFEENRRLLKATCFDAANTTNVWGRPIEGIYAIVDLDRREVVRIVDAGPVPVSREPSRLDAPPPDAAAPSASGESAAAHDFTLDGNAVRWKRWSFRYRMDPRSGLVLSLVRYQDRGHQRLVLYRGSLAEVFVPYMDPEPGWSFRTYLDVGEYGFGPLSLPLNPGTDCPVDAMFLGAVMADADGIPRVRNGVICLFERNTAAPLWRHAETANNTYSGRPAVELVMRTIPSVGNYDYIIDWVLTEAGAIRIDVGASGIDQVKGVGARGMADPSAAHDTAYGSLVAPNLVGVNHDHFLSFRLDVDIDGAANTLVRQRLQPQRLDGSSGRRSLWRLVEEPVEVEGPLKADMRDEAVLWRVENPNLANRLGQHPGYELRPEHSDISLLASDDWPQRRAAFSAAPLWITAYDPTELYAAGPYPNQSHGGDGLPAYVAQHRPVANADLVLWYTMGFHHVPRPEDWPVLPTMWHSVSLVPDGFFDRNPALDLPVDVAPADQSK